MPPLVVAVNRARLLALIATNALGQNTPAIAATEAEYAEMWAQDAAAMYRYAGSSAVATRLTRFAQPQQMANPDGPAAPAAAGPAGMRQTTLSQFISALPTTLQGLASPSSTSAAPGLGGLFGRAGWDPFAPGSGNVTTGPVGLLDDIFGTDTVGGKLLNSGIGNTIFASGFYAPSNTVGPFMSLLSGGAAASAGAGTRSGRAAASGLGGRQHGRAGRYRHRDIVGLGPLGPGRTAVGAAELDRRRAAS